MDLVRRWFAARPGIELVNAYGLTETSDDTNHEVMDRAPEGERVPLGRPVANVRVYVVDEQLVPVPLGAPGEIVFSGVCVGRGYVNDPERTRGRLRARSAPRGRAPLPKRRPRALAARTASSSSSAGATAR